MPDDSDLTRRPRASGSGHVWFSRRYHGGTGVTVCSVANREHLEIFKQGLFAWNDYRYGARDLLPDLKGADLGGRDLREYDLRDADLRGANLAGCGLVQATLTNANLSGADLTEAVLHRAVLLGANASRAKFCRAVMRDVQMVGINLENAQLQHTDLVHARIMSGRCASASFANADLRGAALNQTDFAGCVFTGADLSHTSANEACFAAAKLDGARVYGISVWDVDLTGATQNELIITRKDQPPISVDNLEVAQFIYLLLNNAKLRSVIEAITSKVVLILGPFANERKKVLDDIRAALRRLDFLPVLFDFEKPASKDLTGTIETLARMARFIIADISDPASVPHELATIVPMLRTTPILPLKEVGSPTYSMFYDLAAYPWVLPVHEYTDPAQLLRELPGLIEVAESRRA